MTPGEMDFIGGYGFVFIPEEGVGIVRPGDFRQRLFLQPFCCDFSGNGVALVVLIKV